MQVARKVVILARECGMRLELSDVPIKSLVPDALANWQPKEGEVLADAFVREMVLTFIVCVCVCVNGNPRRAKFSGTLSSGRVY